MRGGEKSWMVKATKVFQKAEKGAILCNIVKKTLYNRYGTYKLHTQGADPPPSSRRTEGKSKLFERGNYPLLPTGRGERYSQTISNLRHAALVRRCELPL